MATSATPRRQDRETPGIDLDRVVWDPAYRKRVMIRLKRARRAHVDEATLTKPSGRKPN